MREEYKRQRQMRRASSGGMCAVRSAIKSVTANSFEGEMAQRLAEGDGTDVHKEASQDQREREQKKTAALPRSSLRWRAVQHGPSLESATDRLAAMYACRRGQCPADYSRRS